MDIDNYIWDRALNLTLSELSVTIASTIEFNRLQFISQLGTLTPKIRNGTCHVRYDHSLGVAYLSKFMVKHLNRVNNNCMLDNDMLCVELAGLCHDIGHGPLSHFWDQIFIPRYYKKYNLELPKKYNGKFKHEKMSCFILLNLFNQTALKPEFEKHNIKLCDIKWICCIIMGNPTYYPAEETHRTVHQHYLCQIVSSVSSIDTDKMDYIIRDGYFTLGRKNINLLELICSSSLYVKDDIPQICWSIDKINTIAKLFYYRSYYHRKVYQTSLFIVYQIMLFDLLELHSKTDKNMYRCITGDIHNYLILDDTLFSYFEKINSQCVQHKEVFDLYTRIKNKYYYNPICYTDEFFPNNNFDIEELSEKLKNSLEASNVNSSYVRLGLFIYSPKIDNFKKILFYSGNEILTPEESYNKLTFTEWKNEMESYEKSNNMNNLNNSSNLTTNKVYKIYLILTTFDIPNYQNYRTHVIEEFIYQIKTYISKNIYVKYIHTNDLIF